MILTLQAFGQVSDSFCITKGLLLENRNVFIPWSKNTAIGTLEPGEKKKLIKNQWENIILFGGMEAKTVSTASWARRRKEEIIMVRVTPADKYSEEEIRSMVSAFLCKPPRRKKTGPLWERKHSTTFQYKWRTPKTTLLLYSGNKTLSLRTRTPLFHGFHFP